MQKENVLVDDKLPSENTDRIEVRDKIHRTPPRKPQLSVIQINDTTGKSTSSNSYDKPKETAVSTEKEHQSKTSTGTNASEKSVSTNGSVEAVSTNKGNSGKTASYPNSEEAKSTNGDQNTGKPKDSVSKTNKDSVPKTNKDSVSKSNKSGSESSKNAKSGSKRRLQTVIHPKQNHQMKKTVNTSHDH